MLRNRKIYNFRFILLHAAQRAMAAAVLFYIILSSPRPGYPTIVLRTMLYASELNWNGGKGVEGEYQRAILGALRSTPSGIVAAGSGMTPARALLDRRRAHFTQRLYARPRDGDGPEEILARERSALPTCLRAAATLRPGETVEAQEWGSCRLLPRRDHRRRESRGPPDCKRVEAPGHHLDRRLAPGQRRSVGGVRMADPRGFRLDRPTLPSRPGQGGF